MTYSAPTKLLICEGIEDRAFFNLLLRDRNVPGYEVIAADGNTKFKQAVNSVRVSRTSFYNSLTDIVFVADNDDDPKGSFDLICKQIGAIFDSSAVPTAPFQTSKRTKTRQQAITLMMMPWTDTVGHLEALCEKAARQADKTIGSQVDHFLAMVRADDWKSESRKSKAWLRANLAVRCARDPFLPLSTVFVDAKQHGLIPISDASFDSIADFLRNL